jgi:hypothetical protein
VRQLRRLGTHGLFAHGLVTLGVLLAASAPAGGQFVIAGREDLAFDRPEAWAMAWFAAVSLPTALTDPAPPAPGAVELGLEGGWIPTLSEEQRTVGFLGTKPEDLNRASVFGRLRLTAGLPGGWSATLGWVPPAEVGGIEPQLVSLAVGRPVWEGETLRLGARLVGQDGSFRGDITCPADAAAAPDDPDRNPYNCEAPSRDEMSVRLLGVEVQAGARVARLPGVTPYLTVGWSTLDAEFQVDARYNGLVDRTVLLTDGDFWWATLGASWHPGDRLRLAAEVFYAPLDITRDPARGTENDPLLNVRAALAYRLR